MHALRTLWTRLSGARPEGSATTQNSGSAWLEDLLATSGGANVQLAPPCPTLGPLSLDQLNIVSLLYTGSYGNKVYLAKAPSGERVVAKVYVVKRLVQHVMLHMVEREVAIMAKLQHANIVRLRGAFAEQGCIVLVMDHATRGDLFSIRKQMRAPRFPEAEACTFARQVLHAVAAVHDMHILHRDIKLENVLVTDHDRALLADFGVSIDTSLEPAVTRTGTRDHMAPEVISCPLKQGPGDNKRDTRFHYGTAADIWSFGIMLYEMLVGATPIVKHVATLPLPDFLSPEAKGVVMACLTWCPEERPSARQLQRFPWFAAEQQAA